MGTRMTRPTGGDGIDETDLNDLLDRTLDDLLVAQLRQHVPDDERVGITGGWIGYTAPGAIYPDVPHRLPQRTRP